MKESKMENTMNTNNVDIIITAYNRFQLTEKCIYYLNERTKSPHRIFVIDNHSEDETEVGLKELENQGKIFHSLRMSKNVGIHEAWNIAIALAWGSEYMVTMDNDIYVPDLSKDNDFEENCWLERLVNLMDDYNNSDFAAIAIQPHAFIGAGALKPAENGVHEHN